MPKTPEGKVKDAVKRVLERYGSRIYGFWPVPYGYGESSLDYIGCVNGKFFAIETKAPGKTPTVRQKQIISRMGRAGGATFVIDDVESPEIMKLDKWLANACK